MGFLRLFTQDEAACKSGVADSFLSAGVTNIYIYIACCCSNRTEQTDLLERVLKQEMLLSSFTFFFSLAVSSSLSLSVEEDALQIADENKTKNAGNQITIVQ